MRYDLYEFLRMLPLPSIFVNTFFGKLFIFMVTVHSSIIEAAFMLA